MNIIFGGSLIIFFRQGKGERVQNLFFCFFETSRAWVVTTVPSTMWESKLRKRSISREEEGIVGVSGAFGGGGRGGQGVGSRGVVVVWDGPGDLNAR